MIRSMTGFGQANVALEDGTVAIEVKTLNSKFLDLSLRLPRFFSEKELEVRSIITERLERGKISVSIEHVVNPTREVPQRYNETMFVAHYAELKKLADKVMANYDNLFEMALKSPDVERNLNDQASAPDMINFIGALKSSLDQCNSFRKTEGAALSAKLSSYIQVIANTLGKIEKLDTPRISRIRARIRNNVKEFFGEEGFDANRLEQEILFYIEKLDIHEERVRLGTHLKYFIEVMEDTQSNGKKLNFIAQEIGREINTIGSKANDAEMQKEVVLMKEELEKIKEQLNNVL